MKTAAFLLVATVATAFSTWAQSDDFNDGNDTGWTHYEPLASYGATGTFNVANGGYRIQAAASTNTALLGAGRAATLRTNLTHTNFYVSADIVASDTAGLGLTQAMGPMARIRESGFGTTDGYSFLLYSSGTVAINRFDNEAASAISSGSVTFNTNDDYRLVFTGSGSTLKGQVYNLTNLTTPLLTLTTTDATYSSGYSGLFAAANEGTSSMADATFDNYVANGGDLIIYDALTSLGTNGTKNYTFTDIDSGEHVTIAVTMFASSTSTNGAAVFTLLDGGTRLGINAGDNSGNWIESHEKVNFSASLVAASSGVATNSIRFGVAKLGIRPNAGGVSWSSSAGTKTVSVSNETLYTLDTTTASIAGTNYSAQLTVAQVQLSDYPPLSGQSIAFTASFSEVQLTAGTQVGGTTNTSAPLLSFIDPSKVVIAANFGGATMVRDGITFTGVTTTSNPMSNSFGNYTVSLSAPSGSLSTATFGDALFGSFIWADNQNNMAVTIDGLDTGKTYQAYYLAGDSRALAFNMFLTLSGSTANDTNSVVGTMSWGGGSSNAQYYIYLPATVSKATSLTATMTKNDSSSGVGISGVILVDTTANTAPTLTAISTLTNATEDTAFTITYDALKNASDAADANGDALSFSIESVSSGTLTKNGTNVVAGSTLLGTNESVAWKPATNANGTLNAFTVKAWDGAMASVSAVQVAVSVTAVNDPPFLAGSLPPQSALYGEPFTFTFATNLFTDVDSAVLSYFFNMSEAYAFPYWIAFDAATRTFSGTPDGAGTFGGLLIANDGQSGAYPILEINVSKANLTVTPADVSRPYGEANPILTGTISGIKNDDNITATYSTTATSSSAPGTYPITATLVDPASRLTNYVVTTNTGTLTVLAPLEPPTIVLSQTNLCSGSTGYTATGPAGMSGYHWTISNATISGSNNGQQLIFAAADPGVVTIALTVTNELGQIGTNSIQAMTYAPPSAAINVGAVCANSAGNTASAPAGMAAYAWTISNGTITSATNVQTITFIAGASGNLGLTLDVTSTAGCNSGNNAEVTISPYPSAIITTSSNVTANSTGNSASAPAGATTYAWSISNGTITSATNTETITYTAGATGSVQLALAVASSAGCSASSLATVPITAPPILPNPLPTSWVTNTSGQYVRLYTNSAAQAAGTTVTTWTFSTINGTNVTGAQASPVYSGIQEMYSSSNWLYIRASGMPAGPIGPLIAYGNAALLLPYNQKSLFRFPMQPSYTTNKTLTPGGAIGYMVDGTMMFDTRDALSWTGSNEGMGTGYWTRDAYINEGYGFDPYQGHAAPGGGYHNHANPQGLRYAMGDHVDYNPVTRTYSESTNTPTKHSPILGWLRDGFPLYGPYGYSSASNSASGIRRMISGFVLRNGQNGTANLSVTGRTNIPPWAQRLYKTNNITGPTVAAYGPLGRYLEDSDFMSDLINPNTGTNYVKGVDYDLDEFNGRWCVTPEFPNGTYAYFVTIETNGAAKYPYYIGRAFFGSPIGGTVSNLTETVTTNFIGGTNMPLRISTPSVSANVVTLSWSGVDGGTYKIESTTNLSNWTSLSTNATAPKAAGFYMDLASEQNKSYRITRTALAPFEAITGTTGGAGGGSNGISSVSPTSGNRGTTFTLTINLDPAVNPPPQNAPIVSVTVGSITGASNVHVSQTQVTSSITIPAGASTGTQTVTVTFPPPPNGSTNTVYTLPNGFTIQ